MPRIELPISKSIANRLLILQAIHGDELAGSPTALASWGALMPVSACGIPDDVQLLHRALTTLHNASNSSQRERPIGGTPSYSPSGRPIAAQAASCSSIELGNCGTSMRFLTAYCAQLEGQTTILDGVERMHHRPIGQLVDALREIGADIEYLGEEGFPPLRIMGKALDKSKPITLNQPQSTQFVSALLLIGANVQTDSTSPYITLTRALIDQYPIAHRASYSPHCGRPIAAQAASSLERDWSSAAFWYEFVALHGGEITLPGLFRDSLQGDKVVADIFAHLGVHTTYTAEGITLSPIRGPRRCSHRGEHFAYSEASYSPLSGRPIAAQAASRSKILVQDFGNCPDLYPAVALTCERLGIELHATGVESLPLKESDRLRAVREHRTDADHRMAMALLVAGYEVDDTACISKSYPQFLEQFQHALPQGYPKDTPKIAPT